MSKPDQHEEAYVKAWLNFTNRTTGASEKGDVVWVIGWPITTMRNNPVLVLNSILEIGRRLENTREICALGCGPLEDLLAVLYEQSIGEVMLLASINDRFAQALRFANVPEKYESDFESRLEKIAPQ